MRVREANNDVEFFRNSLTLSLTELPYRYLREFALSRFSCQKVENRLPYGFRFLSCLSGSCRWATSTLEGVADSVLGYVVPLFSFTRL